jgi:hypothetical protein
MHLEEFAKPKNQRGDSLVGLLVFGEDQFADPETTRRILAIEIAFVNGVISHV